MDKGSFAPALIPCADLAKCLVERVRATNLPEENSPGNDTAWTNAVFKNLREIGEERGFTVFHRPPSGGTGSEFLLDLIWYSDSGGIELGVECQWNRILDQEMKDVKKVVYVKSPLKVLIWWDDTNTGVHGERNRRAIEGYLKTYERHLKGEEYLCVEFGKGHRDRCDSYVVPNDGSVSSVSFMPLGVS
jgi:hypothetical protein